MRRTSSSPRFALSVSPRGRRWSEDPHEGSSPCSPVLLSCLVALPLLAACDRADMVAQDKAQTYDRSRFFPDKATIRPPVPGSVARDAPGEPMAQPAVITEALIGRGRDRYDIFCSPCHGQSGDGRGMIVERGFPQPPPLGTARLVRAKARELYDVIAQGHGVMYGYADRVSPADRWAVVSYIRALQQSQNAEAARLPAEDRAKLENEP